MFYLFDVYSPPNSHSAFFLAYSYYFLVLFSLFFQPLLIQIFGYRSTRGISYDFMTINNLSSKVMGLLVFWRNVRVFGDFTPMWRWHGRQLNRHLAKKNQCVLVLQEYHHSEKWDALAKYSITSAIFLYWFSRARLGTSQQLKIHIFSEKSHHALSWTSRLKTCRFREGVSFPLLPVWSWIDYEIIGWS